jgi:N-acetylmuramoyl-L-alanine amidase
MWLLSGALLSPSLAATRRVAIEPGVVASLTDRLELMLEAEPLPEEGLLAFARRFCGDAEASSAIAAANGGSRRLLASVRYRVPYHLLLPRYQNAMISALFPDDASVEGAWVHQVRTDTNGRPETLWSIASWFTGSGENYRLIRDHNGLPDEEIAPGQRLNVPASLLLAAFREQLPSPRASSDDDILEYGEDQQGKFALYNLERGEALYSSVVVRFTGRIFAEDVIAVAKEVATRSAIADVTDIPVGYAVKIPLDLLAPEFLPRDHPRRREYEENLSRSGQFKNQVRSRDLAGVTVVLDSGHGGADVGTSAGRVWESVYVYDIMLRVKQLLETTTAATVKPTTRDGSSYRIENRDRLSLSQGHAVLTTPPYPIAEARIGTNLRWYLANSVYRKTLSEAASSEKVVFLSIHADWLSPSLRGAMVYVPGQVNVRQSYRKSGDIYESRQEVRESPTVSISEAERVRSEGLSRDLARQLIAAFRRHRLEVHPNQPVRDRVVRARREVWVPAVLRYNVVPAKVLVEVCNLANSRDRELMQTRSYRQSVAAAIVEGIRAYYGFPNGAGGAQLAEAGR